MNLELKDDSAATLRHYIDKAINTENFVENDSHEITLYKIMKAIKIETDTIVVTYDPAKEPDVAVVERKTVPADADENAADSAIQTDIANPKRSPALADAEEFLTLYESMDVQKACSVMYRMGVDFSTHDARRIAEGKLFPELQEKALEIRNAKQQKKNANLKKAKTRNATEAEVLEIYKLLATTNYSNKYIGDKFGFGSHYIYTLKANKATKWKYLYPKYEEMVKDHQSPYTLVKREELKDPVSDDKSFVHETQPEVDIPTEPAQVTKPEHSQFKELALKNPQNAYLTAKTEAEFDKLGVRKFHHTVLNRGRLVELVKHAANRFNGGFDAGFTFINKEGCDQQVDSHGALKRFGGAVHDIFYLKMQTRANKAFAFALYEHVAAAVGWNESKIHYEWNRFDDENRINPNRMKHLEMLLSNWTPGYEIAGSYSASKLAAFVG